MIIGRRSKIPGWVEPLTLAREGYCCVRFKVQELAAGDGTSSLLGVKATLGSHTCDRLTDPRPSII